MSKSFSVPPLSPDGPNKFAVREIQAADEENWNQFVAASPQGNVFMRSDWLRMLAETNSKPLKMLKIGVFNNRNQLRGGWVVPYKERFGLRFSQGFDFFYCGPLLPPELLHPSVRQISERQQILTEMSRAVTSQMDMIVTETHPSLQDVRPFLFEEWVISPEYTHIWDLSDAEKLLQEMNREKRREIRLAKEACWFGREEINQSSLKSFMAVYREAMHKLSVSITLNWESVIRTRINWMTERDSCRLYVSRNKNGELLAGVLVLISPEDQTAYYWRMGYTTQGRDAKVVPALYWQTALEIRSDFPAIRYINFGGSPHSTLSQFKDYLGSTLTEHFRLIYRNDSIRMHLLQINEWIRNAARKQLGTNQAVNNLHRFLRHAHSRFLIPLMLINLFAANYSY